jgi:hypothetical protein
MRTRRTAGAMPAASTAAMNTSSSTSRANQSSVTPVAMPRRMSTLRVNISSSLRGRSAGRG